MTAADLLVEELQARGVPFVATLNGHGLGCRGVRIEKQEELVPALREALAAQAVTVIQVPVVPGTPAG